MAGADAVRSTGSLLVRALAVGGLTAAAWLVGGAVASASPVDHVPDPAGIVDFVHSAVAEHRTSFEDNAILVRDTDEQWSTALAAVPVDLDLAFLDPARPPAEDVETDEEEADEDDEYLFEDASPVYSGGVISSGTERSGTISNSMPEELYTAKVTAKVAAKLAAAPAPIPVEVAVPVEADVVVASPAVSTQWSIPAIHLSAPVVEVGSAASGLEWETPRPAAPAPTPQPASVPTASTASSSAHDNSGGARGGLAMTTARSAPHQPSTWTVERRDDGRTPGSVQGLPSTSPD
ncbi:MAG: hypothetical protein ABIQ18_36395 [Umezawaea sp.]